MTTRSRNAASLALPYRETTSLKTAIASALR